MGMSASGGGGTQSSPSYKTKEKKLTKALVVEDVQIVEKKMVVNVPVLVEKKKEQIKYETKTEQQVKYKTEEKPTTRYIPREEDTVKYRVVEQDTIRYMPKEVEVERPVAVPKEYERPVVKEKIVEIVSYTDLAAIKSFKDMMPELLQEIKDIRKELDGIKKYKLVEELVKVPKIQYMPTPVERIVWKDVERSRPKVDAS